MIRRRCTLLAALGVLSGCIDNPAEKTDDSSTPVPDSGEPFDPDLDDDGVDDSIDCDNTDADVGGPRERWADADGDGYGSADAPGDPACFWEAGWSFTSGDCDDTSAAVHPDAEEVCNGLDDNCDELVDDDDPAVFRTDPVEAFVDADGDGFGDPDQPVVACTFTDDLSLAGTDCDDTNAGVNPDAEEICGSGIDENCDGLPGGECGLSALVPEDTGLIDSATLDELPLNFTEFNSHVHQRYGAVGFDAYGRGEEVVTLRMYRPVADTNVNSGLWTPTEVEDETGFVQVLGSSEGAARTGYDALVVQDFNGDGSADLLLRHTDALSLLEAGRLLPDTLTDQADVVTWTLPYSSDASTDPSWWYNDAGDVNADGLSDLIVTTDARRSFLLYGQADWDAAMADCDGTIEGCAAVVIEAEDSTYLQSGGNRSGTGVDLNGDGFSELLTNYYVYPRGNYMRVLVYDGAVLSDEGAASLGFDDRDVEMIGPDPFPNGHSLGRVMAPAGDLNQDGYADLLLSQWDAYDPRPRIYAGSADWLTRDDWSGGPSSPTLEDATLVIDHTDTIDRFSQLSDAHGDKDLTGDGMEDLALLFPGFVNATTLVVVPSATGWEAVAEGPDILASISGYDSVFSIGVVHNADKGLSEVIAPTGTTAPGALFFSVPGM